MAFGGVCFRMKNKENSLKWGQEKEFVHLQRTIPKNCKYKILIIEKNTKKKPSEFGGFLFGMILALYNTR